MTARTGRSLAVATLTVTLGALALYPAMLDSVPPPSRPADNGGGFLTPVIVAFAVVGALIVWHRPSHPIGRIYAASALLLALSAPLTLYGQIATRVGGQLPGAAIVGPASAVAYVGGLLLPVTFGLLLFPDGHLPSSRWRPVAWAVPVVFVLMYLGATGMSGAALVVGSLGVLALALASIASIFMRFRRSTRSERQQLKWAIAAIGVVVAVLFVLVVSSLLRINDRRITMTGMALALYPLAVGLAILRYRLYDIDVLVNRTLVYGATTAALIATYWIAVLVAQPLLRPFTGGSELAVAIATLIVAALIQPVRRRIQVAIDRRFYRSRYDAARIVDALALRMRDEVDLDTVRREFIVAARQTMQPANASVWLRHR